MLTHYIYTLLFQFIPEGIALAFLSLVFLDKRTNLKNLLLIGGINGGTTFLFRLLPISFIFHTILAFLILTLLIKQIYNINIIDSFTAVLKSFIILGILELISINIFIKISNTDLKKILASPLLKTLALLLQVSIIFIIGFVLKYRRKKKKMNLYQKIVENLSKYITNELKIPSTKKDILRFGIEIFLSTSITLFLSIFPAFILGTAKPVIIILLAGASLKILTGGIHLKSPWECAVFTSISVNLLGLVSYNYYKIIYNHWLIFVVVSFIYIFISLLLWSPADVPEKPITKKKKIKFFKITSIVFTSIIFFVVILLFYFKGPVFGILCTGLLLGLLFQSLTINPLFYKLRENYYYIKNHIVSNF